MATYYQHGAQEIQQEGLQTLYLMNPGYPGYADAPGAASANILLLNSAASLNPLRLSNAAPIATNNQQQFLGIPLQPTAPAPVPNTEISSLQAFSSTTHPTLWGSAMSPQLGHRHHQQGLSLSLSPQQTSYVPAQDMPPARTEEVRISTASSSATWLSNGLSGLPSFWVGSKYLKVAQELLDEVVSVGDGIKGESQKICESKSQLRSSKEAEPGKEEGRGAKHVAELTTAERQELQIKSAKLLNMLEEVEQRYKQYHNQMQIIVSSFEAVAGIGAARTYTALALQTISKQFRGLRDAISVQVRATAKILGEEGCLGGDKFQGSRLRLIDHQNGQQRALQQIGMIQHNAWRPQRGLPERSVSILRAWLFEHFLHPYPKDSDKQILAKQTGLTRSQVSNWFINARVRLWKPMVEEMYLEELKGEEQNNEDEKRSKISNTNGESTSKSNANQGISSERIEQTNQQLPAFTLPHSALLDDNQELHQLKPKRARSNESMQSNTMQHSMNVDFVSKDMESQGYSFLTSKMTNGDIGFSGYSIGPLERFDAEQFTPRVLGKSVSLTLGLPNCENLSLSRGHPSYLAADSIPFGRRAEIGSSNNEFCGLGNDPSVVHASNNFQGIDAQSRKRFAAHLLPDFVA